MNGCKIQAVPGSGSDRRYFILSKADGANPVVVTYGENIRENRAFIYLSRKFSEAKINVPKVYNHTDNFQVYSQEYVGSRSLFDLLAPARGAGVYGESDKLLLRKAIDLIASIHSLNAHEFDPQMLFPKARMDVRMVRYDLNYFKYCFLKPSGIDFDEDRLQDEFDKLERLIMEGEQLWRSFMYRDFQSRNVMVSDDSEKVYGIDFQGGRIGPSEYDLASFLWQAKAAYPQWLKDDLLNYYIKVRSGQDSEFDASDFMRKFYTFVLFRILQTLGAYGFRGWVERKPHFLSSIEAGIRNLQLTTTLPEIADKFPYLANIADKLFDKYEKN